MALCKCLVSLSCLPLACGCRLTQSYSHSPSGAQGETPIVLHALPSPLLACLLGSLLFLEQVDQVPSCSLYLGLPAVPYTWDTLAPDFLGLAPHFIQALLECLLLREASSVH